MKEHQSSQHIHNFLFRHLYRAVHYTVFLQAHTYATIVISFFYMCPYSPGQQTMIQADIQSDFEIPITHGSTRFSAFYMPHTRQIAITVIFDLKRVSKDKNILECVFNTSLTSEEKFNLLQSSSSYKSIGDPVTRKPISLEFSVFKSADGQTIGGLTLGKERVNEIIISANAGGDYTVHIPCKTDVENIDKMSIEVTSIYSVKTFIRSGGELRQTLTDTTRILESLNGPVRPMPLTDATLAESALTPKAGHIVTRDALQKVYRNVMSLTSLETFNATPAQTELLYSAFKDALIQSISISELLERTYAEGQTAIIWSKDFGALELMPSSTKGKITKEGIAKSLKEKLKKDIELVHREAKEALNYRAWYDNLHQRVKNSKSSKSSGTLSGAYESVFQIALSGNRNVATTFDQDYDTLTSGANYHYEMLYKELLNKQKLENESENLVRRTVEGDLNVSSSSPNEFYVMKHFTANSVADKMTSIFDTTFNGRANFKQMSRIAIDDSYLFKNQNVGRALWKLQASTHAPQPAFSVDNLGYYTIHFNGNGKLLIDQTSKDPNRYIGPSDQNIDEIMSSNININSITFTGCSQISTDKLNRFLEANKHRLSNIYLGCDNINGNNKSIEMLLDSDKDTITFGNIDLSRCPQPNYGNKKATIGVLTIVNTFDDDLCANFLDHVNDLKEFRMIGGAPGSKVAQKLLQFHSLRKIVCASNDYALGRGNKILEHFPPRIEIVRTVP